MSICYLYQLRSCGDTGTLFYGVCLVHLFEPWVWTIVYVPAFNIHLLVTMMYYLTRRRCSSIWTVYLELSQSLQCPIPDREEGKGETRPIWTLERRAVGSRPTSVSKRLSDCMNSYPQLSSTPQIVFDICAEFCVLAAPYLVDVM